MSEARRSRARNGLRLVVVNDEPAPAVSERAAAPRPAAPPPSRKTSRFDPRFVDLAAVIFTISLAFLLAYVFDSLDRADKELLCVMAGSTCN